MMSISTERLMAVFRPLQFRTSKLSTSRIVHFLVFILPPLLIAILLNVPKFLEIEFVINETNIPGQGMINCSSVKYRKNTLQSSIKHICTSS